MSATRTSDEEYAVGSCLVEDWGGRLRNGAAPVPVLPRQFCTGFCSSALVIADVALC